MTYAYAPMEVIGSSLEPQLIIAPKDWLIPLPLPPLVGVTVGHVYAAWDQVGVNKTNTDIKIAKT